VKKVYKKFQVFGAIVILTVAIFAKPPLAHAASDPWWNPDITAQQAADLYCAAPGHAGAGVSALIPTEGLTLTDSQWTNVVLRGVGCGGAGAHQVTFYGLDHVSGQPPIDFSQSGSENVTGQSTVTDADGNILQGDELWMVDTGIIPADGSGGTDTTLRINRSQYPSSGTYAITTHGMGWYPPTQCPTPLHYSDIGTVPGCDFSAMSKTNQTSGVFNITIDALPPSGDVKSITNTITTGGTVGQACNTVSGWASDQDNPASTLTVNVYTNTAPTGQTPVLNLIYTTTANGSRTDQYNGHGFTVPQDILNQQVSLNNAKATLYIKAVGVEQNGTPVGDADGTDIGTTDISACLPASPKTGIHKQPLTITLLAGSFVAITGYLVLQKRRLTRR